MESENATIQQEPAAAGTVSLPTDFRLRTSAGKRLMRRKPLRIPS
ncbi:MAG: hypothetical protein V8S69_00970 [Dakarella massiliensis]